MLLRRVLRLITLPLLLPASAAAAPPIVVELFTSQGCSSCPPADALLGVLAQRPDVVALAFHVDYWDRLGWHDAFALPVAADRQRRYARVLDSTPGVFTPQAIVGGQRSAVGSDRAQLEAAIEAATSTVTFELAVAGGELSIDLPMQQTTAVYDIDLAAYRKLAVTRVGRGENAGRSLTEFNIVRSFRRIGTWDGSAARLHVALTGLPADVDHVAVWLQAPEQGAVAGAAAVALR